MNFNSVCRLFMMIGLMLTLSACIKSKFTIDYPINGGRYVGTEAEPAPLADSSVTALQSEFRIRYDSAPGDDIQILLNGHNVNKHFSFEATSAVADSGRFKHFFRQGKNTLSVDPLGFGPSVIFNVDTSGPVIVVTRGEMAENGNSIEIEGFLRDPSNVSHVLELNLVQLAGYANDGSVIRNFDNRVNIDVSDDGSFCACGDDEVDISGLIVAADPGPKRSLLYSFRATDIYGYPSTKEYLADSDFVETLAIDNAVRVAIGDSFIASMRPIVASGIHKSLADAPIDIRDSAWDDLRLCGRKRGTILGQDMTELDAEGAAREEPPRYPQPCTAGNDGMVLPVGLNPVDTPLLGYDFETHINQVYMHDGSAKVIDGVNIEGRKATVLLNGFKVKKDNLLDVDMIITEMLVDMDVDGRIIFFDAHIELSMYIQQIIVDTDAKVVAHNKKVDVELQNSNFDLQGIRLSQASINIFSVNIPITGIGNFIIPIIEGLIGGLLPDILNPILEENLQKIVLGGTVTQPSNNTAFDMLLNISEMGTGNSLGPNNPFDLLVELESVADVLMSDIYVKPTLGPVFFDDPIRPSDIFNSLGDSGTNMTVAVSSNLINQSLAAVYAIGASHITIHNNNVYFGADPQMPVDPEDNSKTLANEGDARIRLWPDMPPALSFSEMVTAEGAGRAAVTYDSATLFVDKAYVDSDNSLQWKSDFELQVDFELAVKINEEDGKFTLAADGPPSFTINKMVNHTPYHIPSLVVQAAVDIALMFSGDFLADKFVVLDLGTIAETFLNGTVVNYLSAEDNYLIDLESYPDACISFDNDGQVEPLVDGVTVGGGDGYDLICETIDFVVNTNTVGVTGLKGSNLFFQMEARDKSIPPSPAIPRFDLDDDGTLDYRDNCKVGQYDLADAINIVTGGSGLANFIDEDGHPIAGFEDDLRNIINQKMAVIYGGGSAPTITDITNWNHLRVNDHALSQAELGLYPWIGLLYSNINQYNSDNDRFGELCEDDQDFDGVYTDNGLLKIDNCPTVYNPGQEDTLHPIGVGDACNVRTTYVLLRSLESKEEAGGIPRCLAHSYNVNEGGFNHPSFSAGGGWVSDVMHAMLPCDADDPRQRFYMKAVKGADLSEGVEFYTRSSRSKATDSRLAAYGRHKRVSVCYSGAETISEELRLVNVDDTRIRNENDDVVSACLGASSYDRADPIWWPRIADTTLTFDEITHPWYIDNNFNFDFSYFNGSESKRGASCMTYTKNWGVDIDSSGQPGHCAEGDRWRWAIWVGGNDSGWNGVW